tara:strand:+ start:4009 stop:4305 length:297 start_codon:yes stop_codon:yes gene_type:complete
MAISRRDRSFSKIINEVDVETIPVHFIKRLKLSLDDGSLYIIEQDEVQKASSIEELLMSMAIASQIIDMSIELDYDGIELDVTEKVTNLLNKDEDKKS